MTDIAPDGPFRLEMKIMFIGIAGDHKDYIAHVNINLPAGKIPSAGSIQEWIAKAQEEIGPNFRLANRYEFMDDLTQEVTGTNMKFAHSGPNTFTLAHGEAA